MSRLAVTQPMRGCYIVACGGDVVLFGQPPEVLKSLLRTRPGALDALVLPDVRERSGSLLNNVEFLLYAFLFLEDGFTRGRRLKLIGDAAHISQVLELLRLTLLGPTPGELDEWGTEDTLKQEWVNASRFFALKDDAGNVRPVPTFFEILPFENDVVCTQRYRIERLGTDRFALAAGRERVEVDLNGSADVEPPYGVATDYVPAGLVKFGVEVLGGASGFSPEQPSTGFVLCFNGNYLLIDAIPYLDWHLRARGISKNQISAVFLTHLHDDHCNMFPLMLMPHKVDVITTREIFRMAMRKLAMGLGWRESAVEEHFNFIELRVGQRLNYYGLEIEPHHPVHSIPTVGAVFRTTRHGRPHEICLVGDIQTFSEIGEMCARGLIRPETERCLRELYERRFDLLIADGGMGPIHGNPADALGSKAERVVFVHVDRLPEEFNATFSVAASGKRYTVLDGDSDIYTTRTIELLMRNFQRPLPGPWLSTLFADKEIKRYNTDDVIIKQGSQTWGRVFLILTGYCEVIHHDGTRFSSLATREAGDLIGEMAIVTGRALRNASVVARTPVMACEFSEETFDTFLDAVGLKEALLSSWSRRGLVGMLPQFASLSSTVVDVLCAASHTVTVATGERFDAPGADTWDLVCDGALVDPASGERFGPGSEVGGFRPYARGRPGRFEGVARCTVLRIPAAAARELLRTVPQLNYRLRRFRASDPDGIEDWTIGIVPETRHRE